MTTTTTAEAAARHLADAITHRLALSVAALLRRHRTDQATGDLLPRRYLLVEKSSRDGRNVYLTCHDSHEDASDYWGTQEYPEDWLPWLLVDLLTGKRFEPVPSLTFHSVKRGQP